jgi:hypothetical protein
MNYAWNNNELWIKYELTMNELQMTYEITKNQLQINYKLMVDEKWMKSIHDYVGDDDGTSDVGQWWCP